MPELPPTDDARRVRDRFRGKDEASHYRCERFPPRRARAEERTVAKLLPDLGEGLRLDLACGAGRFGALLAGGGRVVALDASEDMLREARTTGAYAALLAGDAFRLPFRDGAFAAASCVRLLPHFGADDRRRILSELRRVVRGRAVVSFLDAATLEALRARRKRTRGASRRAIRLRDLEEDLAASGWRLVRVARKLGRLTEHVFALVETRG